MTVKNIVFIVLLTSMHIVFGQVGIGTIIPDESAALDVSDTERGMLLPRITTVERNSIESPAKGLIIYNLTENCLQINSGNKISPNWACIEGRSSFSSTSTTVLSDCSVNGFVGNYALDVPLDSITYSDRFTFTITNNGFSDVSFNLSSSDLVLSGVSGVYVGAFAPSTFTLTSGESQFVQYAILGTPENTGILTGTWTKLDLTCTDTIHVLNPSGDAVFSNIPFARVLSVNDGLPLVDIQGIIDNGTNQLTIDIPYTSGSGTYGPFTGAFIVNNANAAEGSDQNEFRLSYPGGVFSTSGVITATIEVDGDESFSAKKQLMNSNDTIVTLDFEVNGINKGNVIVEVLGGIPDLRFSDPDHRFVYIPMLVDGRLWLSNNLGAGYANIINSSYPFNQQAVTHDDYRAYGSSFQWGRFSEGHELMNYSNSTTGSGSSNGVRADASPTDIVSSPNEDWYILETPPSPPYDWRLPQNNNLWQEIGATGIYLNDPCPTGYRLPTESELTSLLTTEGITNLTNAASSQLAFTSTGYRRSVVVASPSANLSSINSGVSGHYWTRDVNGTNSRSLTIDGTINWGNTARAQGSAVRCVHK